MHTYIYESEKQPDKLQAVSFISVLFELTAPSFGARSMNW